MARRRSKQNPIVHPNRLPDPQHQTSVAEGEDKGKLVLIKQGHRVDVGSIADARLT